MPRIFGTSREGLATGAGVGRTQYKTDGKGAAVKKIKSDTKDAEIYRDITQRNSTVLTVNPISTDWFFHASVPDHEYQIGDFETLTGKTKAMDTRASAADLLSGDANTVSLEFTDDNRKRAVSLIKALSNMKMGDTVIDHERGPESDAIIAAKNIEMSDIRARLLVAINGTSRDTIFGDSESFSNNKSSKQKRLTGKVSTQFDTPGQLIRELFVSKGILPKPKKKLNVNSSEQPSTDSSMLMSHKNIIKKINTKMQNMDTKGIALAREGLEASYKTGSIKKALTRNTRGEVGDAAITDSSLDFGRKTGQTRVDPFATRVGNIDIIGKDHADLTFTHGAMKTKPSRYLQVSEFDKDSTTFA